MTNDNPTPRLDAVLFDMDGVLADSEVQWNAIDAAMLAEQGVEYHGEHKEHVLGKSFPLALQFYIDTYGLTQSIEQLQSQRTAIAMDYYATRIDAFPAVAHVLTDLKAMGLRLAVATSSVGALARPFLERHGITHFFDAIITGEEVTRGKPHPDIYLLAARKVNAMPANCLVVEDALAGVQAGKSAAMRVAAIPDARWIDPQLFIGKADYFLNDLAELTGLVARLRAG